MSLHDVAVKLGISYTSNKDVENKLADYICQKIMSAAKIYETKFNSTNQNITFTFVEVLRTVWKDNDGNKKFFVRDQFIEKYFPDVCGKERPIMFTTNLGDMESNAIAECIHIFDKYSGITILVNAIESSNSLDIFRKNLDFLLSTVRHECDHIFSQSQVIAGADFESRILYYMDTAEVRAFSKQLAYIYFKAYPGKTFNYPTLVKLISDNFPNLREINIVLSFMNDHDPNHFQKPESRDYVINRILVPGHEIDIKSLKKTFQEYINFITYYIQELNKNNNLS